MHAGLGTRLRRLLDQLDADVARAGVELGLVDYRPRFSPVVRALVADGPLSIRELAATVGVTHSAASQTVAQMERADLVTLRAGPDARQRIVRLTPKTRRMLPAIEAEWTATAAAMSTLDEELPYPLTGVVEAVFQALERRPFHDRILDELNH
ncbi:MarR family winged helix-turn-helix transcriptional regulator [Fodinicola feengrottensis]|uniref:Helix-turn-helix domain-containing protein n=1 Tax=Fodinicola feengrottensis TaxID=435914 RepID=A0ABN2GPA3_9ACTN|nr:MarR family winged helix-turn-helix transcriptional regulator [Fodinicola feengrottensis]